MLVLARQFIELVMVLKIKKYIIGTGITVHIFFNFVMYHYATFVGFEAIEHAIIRRKQSSVLICTTYSSIIYYALLKIANRCYNMTYFDRVMTPQDMQFFG